MTDATKRLARVAALLAVIASAAIPQGAAAHAQDQARHEVYPVPPSGSYMLHGRGAGHGHGMSQWGAYAAAKLTHKSTKQILQFYYPHTSLAMKPTSSRMIRVLILAVNGPSRGFLQVEPATGLTVDPAPGKPIELPTKAKHHPITGWRLQRNGKAIDLREQFHGHWHTTNSVGSKATFTDTAQQIPVVQPGGVVRYRGAMTAEIRHRHLEPVNTVDLESYLRAVVPSEMPSSWSPAALRVQAIAARTYALYEVLHANGRWFDVFSDDHDQAYGGIAVEAAPTTAAVKATAGKTVVGPNGHPIFAQFGSGNGGWTVDGGFSYLPAQHDPYDGLIPNSAHSWSATLSAAAVETAYPAIGALKDLVVTGRDGNGIWGGRITAATLQGTKSSVDLTGYEVQYGIGLQSSWFRPIPPPGAPRGLKTKVSHKRVTVTWKAPHSPRGAAPVTGYRVTVSPGHHRKKLPATARHASFGKLTPGSYTIAVAASSSAGHGKAATVVVKTGHK